MERIKRNLAERHLREPAWLWRAYLGTMALIAVLMVDVFTGGTPGRTLAVALSSWTMFMFGVRAGYHRRWKARGSR